MIDEVCKNLLSDTSVKDNQITNALRHMITWLQWPKHVNLHLWIIRLCLSVIFSLFSWNLYAYLVVHGMNSYLVVPLL